MYSDNNSLDKILSREGRSRNEKPFKQNISSNQKMMASYNTLKAEINRSLLWFVNIADMLIIPQPYWKVILEMCQHTMDMFAFPLCI